jgi:hypothetical protein
VGDTDCTTLLRVSSKWDMRSKEPGNGLVPRTSARRLKDGSLSSGTLIKICQYISLGILFNGTDTVNLARFAGGSSPL